MVSNLDQIIADAPLYKLAVELGHVGGYVADAFYYLDDSVQDHNPDLIEYPTIFNMTNIERLDLIIKIAEQAKLRIREVAK